MKRAAQITVAAIIIGLGIWLWTVLHPSTETIIRSRLNALAKVLSFNSKSGVLGQAYDAQKAAEFFTTDVDVEVNLAGYEPISLHGRDEVLQIAMASRSRLTSLKIEFPDMNISIAADGQSAKVNLTGKGIIPGERDISAQEFNFLMKKVDGKWLIYQVETVKTLSTLVPDASTGNI